MADSLLIMLLRACTVNSAKNTRPINLRTAIDKICHKSFPSFAFLCNASGMAAPILKRKKGNTRSTQLMPATSGLNTCEGGGVCAWYIHGGKMPKAILLDNTIASIAKPRSASRDWFLCVIVNRLISAIGNRESAITPETLCLAIRETANVKREINTFRALRPPKADTRPRQLRTKN